MATKIPFKVNTTVLFDSLQCLATASLNATTVNLADPVTQTCIITACRESVTPVWHWYQNLGIVGSIIASILFSFLLFIIYYTHWTELCLVNDLRKIEPHPNPNVERWIKKVLKQNGRSILEPVEAVSPWYGGTGTWDGAMTTDEWLRRYDAAWDTEWNRFESERLRHVTNNVETIPYPRPALRRARQEPPPPYGQLA